MLGDPVFVFAGLGALPAYKYLRRVAGLQIPAAICFHACGE
jgi:hypothetical protein